MTVTTGVEVAVVLRHLDTDTGLVRADVTIHSPSGSTRTHHVRHNPTAGWRCLCDRGAHCPHLATIRKLVPPLHRTS